MPVESLQSISATQNREFGERPAVAAQPKSDPAFLTNDETEMTEWHEVILNVLERFRGRLQSRPGMEDWDLGCRMLGVQLMRLTEQFTRQFSEQPSRFDRHLSSEEPEATLPTAPDEVSRKRLERITETLVHHWLNEVSDVPLADRPGSKPDANHEGIEICQRLANHLGRRKQQQTSRNVEAEEAYSRLNGNPLHDILLVDDIVSGDGRAIACFTEMLAPSARPILYRYSNHYEGSPEERWLTFVTDFVGPRMRESTGQELAQPPDGVQTMAASNLPKIARYAGSAGLVPFVLTALTRDLIQRPQRSWRIDDFLKHLTFEEQWESLVSVISHERLEEVVRGLRFELARFDADDSPELRVKHVDRFLTAHESELWWRSCEQVRTSRARDIAGVTSTVPAGDRECDALLIQLWLLAIQSLSSRERLVIYLCFQDGEDNRTIAQVLQVAEGTASRTRDRALRKMLSSIESRLAEDDDFSGDCRQCWSEIVSDPRRLHESLLAALSVLPAPKDPPNAEMSGAES